MRKTSTATLTRLGSACTRGSGIGLRGPVSCVLACAIALLMFGGSALAQPRAASPTPTPQNPNWCAGIAAPPGRTYSAAEWASIRQTCTNKIDPDNFYICSEACLAAQDLWERWRLGEFKHPPASKWPAPTDKLQGPFPLQGGAKGYIMPLVPRRRLRRHRVARKDRLTLRHFFSQSMSC